LSKSISPFDSCLVNLINSLNAKLGLLPTGNFKYISHECVTSGHPYLDSLSQLELLSRSNRLSTAIFCARFALASNSFKPLQQRVFSQFCSRFVSDIILTISCQRSFGFAPGTTLYHSALGFASGTKLCHSALSLTLGTTLCPNIPHMTRSDA
jgi:hypothetical protein